MKTNLMCPNLDDAYHNRERVKQGYGDAFYDSQSLAIARWKFGEPKPDSVILGGLSIVNMGRLPERSTIDYF